MNKKVITMLLVGLVGLPMAAAANSLENVDVVTGHTVYANMGGFDEDIAAIAGLAETKVVWFNGQTIFNTLGSGYVYATEAGNCEPKDATNWEIQDYNLSYRDPNDKSHIVAHYEATCAGTAEGLLGTDQFGGMNVIGNQTVHFWVTYSHDRVRDNPLTVGDAGRWYNFALAVDTSLMSQGEDDVQHSDSGGRTTGAINDGDSYCYNEDDHVCNGGTVDGEDDAAGHTHNSASVDLYFLKYDQGKNADSPLVGAGNHTGTVAGCTQLHPDGWELYPDCVIVTDPMGNYTDPTGAS